MTQKNKTIITADKKSNNLRLDIFLAKKLNITRSRAQKMINNEQVTINEKQPKKAGDIIKNGDTIKLAKPARLPKSTELTKPNDCNESSPKLKIVAETDDYLIINKPPGLITHPTIADEPTSVASILAKKYPEIKKVGDEPNLRPGIVHRLDKDASGLLVVARTPEMFKQLKQQFKNREINKEYLVLVHGRVEADTGIIDFPIKRSKNSERMAAIPSYKRGIITNQGKQAKTEFWVEKRFTNFTLLQVKIYTGRMHQIRVHLLAYNHPVVGDQLYWQKKQSRRWDERLGRLFLHCTKLEFKNLASDTQTFISKLPSQLNNFLKIL